MSKNPDFRPVFIVVGMEEAEEARDYLREGGFDSYHLDPGTDPQDGSDWDVLGHVTSSVKLTH